MCFVDLLCLCVTATAIKFPEVPLVRQLPPVNQIPADILAQNSQAARLALTHIKLVFHILSCSRC